LFSSVRRFLLQSALNTRTHYDVAIIGAGMSGLAAGIRLAHFGRSVCVFERHNAVGGLNSFYSLAGRKYDVGLHAMTNFVRPGIKGTPLTKLLRQLRIERDEFALCEQKQSRIAFGGNGEISLRFTNDFPVLESEVGAKFPAQIDGFRALVAAVKAYDDVSLTAQPESARAIVRRHISDPLLEDMLFCPVMYYGSATERDMEFGQFVIMFKALYLEGFARPFEGVRLVLRVLLDKYRKAGGERRMKCGVQKMSRRSDGLVVLTLDSGEEITAHHVISSIGAAETDRLIAGASLGGTATDHGTAAPGRLTFVETITVLNRQPADFGWGEDTIIFFNDSRQFEYAHPSAAVDPRSGVICIPNNFDFGDGQRLAEGIVRVTCLANYERWASLPEEGYRAQKQQWFAEIQRSARRFLPALPSLAEYEAATVATDMFTPRTITKFTGHLNGAIYGAPTKNRQGRTTMDRVYLCGTDQGFLGIVGAMLSGISMANYHILQKEASAGEIRVP
jgi:phytoene dehydrogenase-like protein